MFQTDLRKLFLTEELDEAAGPIYPKDDGSSYIFDESGVGIIEISKPRRVIVPMLEYSGTSEYVASAVQERLAALATCQVPQTVYMADTPQSALHRLRVGLRDHGGLAAIIGSRTVLTTLDFESEVPLFLAPLLVQGDILYGVPPASAMGRIVKKGFKVGLMAYDRVSHIRASWVRVIHDEELPKSPRSPRQHCPTCNRSV